jgi:DNA-binding SARP family transcriptional activator
VSRLNIKLLGGFAITCDDRPVSSLTSLRSQALLAYLLLHHDAPQPRQRLAFDLWADSSDTQARTNLRKELSYLRRDLPQADTHLIIASKTLQWSPLSTFSLDVLTFEQAIKTATDPACPNPQSHLEQAIELYRGELLPSCEDEWIGSERDRLQQLYIHALEQLIECLQEQKNYRLALNYAQQLLRLDTLNEATYSTLRYSLLSLDRYRMICTFDAPDTGSVREAYARMGLQRKIWPGQFFRSDMFPSEADRPNLYVIEGSIPNLSEADWNEMWQKFLQSCQAARLEWLQLYISLDRRHFLSEFYAPDVESLQAIQQQVELPYDRIWPAQRLQP